MIQTELTVQAAGQEYPVMLDAVGYFHADLGEANHIEAPTLSELRSAAAGYKAQRFELPFTVVRNGQAMRGVATGFHAMNGSLLVRWESGKHTQERAYELRDAMPALDEFDWARLAVMLAERRHAIEAVEKFLASHKIGDIKEAALAAQRAAAGLADGNA